MTHVLFIGAGNMGSTMACAVSKTKKADGIAVYDIDHTAANALAQTCGGTAVQSLSAAGAADYIFLCVKPHQIAPVLAEIAPYLKDGQTICSIAAGVEVGALETVLARHSLILPVVRIMPNTPAAVGQGVLLVTTNEHVTQEKYAWLAQLLAPCGLVERVGEAELDLATALTGCGPAFAYLFIEALADGAVQIGVSRAHALRYAAQMMAGAAAMALQTGKHPGQLKDEVCSPGGSTIAGVAALERGGFRAAAAGAVVAAYEKNKTLGK